MTVLFSFSLHSVELIFRLPNYAQALFGISDFLFWTPPGGMFDPEIIPSVYFFDWYDMAIIQFRQLRACTHRIVLNCILWLLHWNVIASRNALTLFSFYAFVLINCPQYEPIIKADSRNLPQQYHTMYSSEERGAGRKRWSYLKMPNNFLLGLQ